MAYKGASHVFAKHFLYLHLGFFPENLGSVSDEHDERFYQDIQAMKESYQGVWNESLICDFCWMLW